MEFVDLAAQRARLGDGIDRAIARVLDHGQFIMGPEVFELERQLSQFCGARHVVCCSSGTDALLLALLAWGVGRGDAVFVPSFTFAATAEVVALVGATPVFVDIDAESFNIDARSLGEAIRATVREAGQLRPVGVITVDLFGQPADYDEVRAVVAEHGMWVLADAAQSFGATYRGRKAGTLGDVTATSFFPAKPLGCYGDGGAVLTDDDDLARSMRSLRVHGQGADKYDNVRVGINGRLDTLQAAVLLEKMEMFPEELASRRAVAVRYTSLLGTSVSTPVVAAGTESAWAQYTIRLDDRDGVAKGLSAHGIPTAMYYPTPLHHQPAYRSLALRPVRLDNAEQAADTVLSLPMHPYLEEAEQRLVVEVLRVVATQKAFDREP